MNNPASNNHEHSLSPVSPVSPGCTAGYSKWKEKVISYIKACTTLQAIED